MIELATECKQCSHYDVCKYRDNARIAMKKLFKMQYGTGPNDDYSWSDTMLHMHVNITFSCSDYRAATRPEILTR